MYSCVKKRSCLKHIHGITKEREKGIKMMKGEQNREQITKKKPKEA